MSRLPDPASVPRRLTGGDESSLDVIARLLLDAVDGRGSIADLADTCGVEPDLACRIVADLARRGVLAVPGCEAGAPADSQPPATGEGGSSSGRGALGSEFAADVDRYFHALRKWNFYELLGVPPDADRKQARAAYFVLSKKFHPDRAFGGDAADLRKKMEVVFRRLTQAYEVISSPAQRAEYDVYIADQIAVWKMERQLFDALESRDAASEEEDAGKRSSVLPVADQRPTAPPRASAARSSPCAVPSVPPAARPQHDSTRRQWQRERAKRALQQTLGVAGEGGKAEPARRRLRPAEIEELLSRGTIAADMGSHAEAVRIFTEALAADPRNARASELLAKAKIDATQALAAGYLRQGRYERLQGDVERARASLSSALEVDPKNIEARYQLADLLFAERLDLARALTLAREVVALGGQRARYFAILGELLLLAKDIARARESFSRAAQLEPDNKDYRKRLKACKG